jgi:uncharacterized membrane protein YtjA (UPF0391 family)
MADVGSTGGLSLGGVSCPITEVVMLTWALIFFLIALVAGVLGFTNIAAGAALVARFFFAVFLLLFLLVLIATLLATA